jgi:hypothetical protein
MMLVDDMTIPAFKEVFRPILATYIDMGDMIHKLPTKLSSSFCLHIFKFQLIILVIFTYVPAIGEAMRTPSSKLARTEPYSNALAPFSNACTRDDDN